MTDLAIVLPMVAWYFIAGWLGLLPRHEQREFNSTTRRKRAAKAKARRARYREARTYRRNRV